MYVSAHGCLPGTPQNNIWYMTWPYLDKNDVAAYEVKISSTDIDPVNKTGKRKVKHHNISAITY